MSDKAAIFEGTYHDIKTVRTRGMMQIIIEMPLQRGTEFVKHFGMPTPEAEIPVAIAHLNLKAAASEPPAQKDRRKFDDLPYPQQAGIVANEQAFWRYVQEKFYKKIDNESEAAAFIRWKCGVKSRAELTPADEAAVDSWRALLHNYQAWKMVA